MKSDNGSQKDKDLACNIILIIIIITTTTQRFTVYTWLAK
jgi:hypothetical protein